MAETMPEVEEVKALKNEYGTIKIADEVVAVIAGLAASEVEGVAGMSGGLSSGVAELLGRKNLSKGVKVEVGEKEAAVDISLVVEYGARIPETAEEIQRRVQEAVGQMTGLKVVEVNVHVQGVHFPQQEAQPAEAPEAPRVR